MNKVEIKFIDGFYVAETRSGFVSKAKVLSKLLSKLSKYYKSQGM